MPSDLAYVLDVTVLADCARGDAGLIGMIQQFDADSVTLIVPALAVTGAAADVGGSPDKVAVIRGICRLASARLAGLVEFDDASELARIRLTATSLEHLWDVQTAETALNRRTPILTLDHHRWKETVREVSGDLTVVEVSDLDA
ncbi:hypothetical protein [Planomonospora alba]